VLAALGYTGHTLPASVSGEARLLAVLCMLRMRPSGFARLPTGLLRALQLGAPARAIAELQEAGWLHYYGRPHGGPAVFLAELITRQTPVRAGQWALRCLSSPLLRGQDASLRLTALTLAAWLEPGQPVAVIDPEQAARSCGLSVQHFLETADRARTLGFLTDCALRPNGLLSYRQVIGEGGAWFHSREGQAAG
jgi:hypothetical protein